MNKNKLLRFLSYFCFTLGVIDIALSYSAGIKIWSYWFKINLPEIIAYWSGFIVIVIGYSLYYASQSKENFKKFLNNLKALMWALLIAGIIRTSLVEPFKIPSGSMKPNLLVGDFLFVSKWDYGYSRYSFPFGFPPFKGILFNDEPERGDIIVFKLPGQENINYVKRLVGLPGETIKIINGKIYLKGINENEFVMFSQEKIGNFFDADVNMSFPLYNENNYKILDGRPGIVKDMTGNIKKIIIKDNQLDNTPEFFIPEGKYFFMGDNRDNSLDSRASVGFVPKENIIGKVWFIWFSIDTNPFKIRFERIFTLVK